MLLLYVDSKLDNCLHTIVIWKTSFTTVLHRFELVQHFLKSCSALSEVCSALLVLCILEPSRAVLHQFLTFCFVDMIASDQFDASIVHEIGVLLLGDAI